VLSNARGDVDEAKRASACADHPPNYSWLIAALIRGFSEVMLPFTTGSDHVNQIGLETDEDLSASRRSTERISSGLWL
jgi:hypothetical protein